MTRKGDFSFGSYLNLEMPVIELVSKNMPEGLKAKCEPAAGECYQDTKDLSSNRFGGGNCCSVEFYNSLHTGCFHQ